MRRELIDVEELLLTYGLEWLETHTNLSAFRWANDQLELRKLRKTVSD